MTVQIHPTALTDGAHLGDGTRVWAFAHVMPEAVIGAFCNICDHAYVEGGVRLGNNVTVKNAVQIFDGVEIEDDVFLGPGTVFTNDLRPRSNIKRPPAEFLPTVVRRGATLGANATIVCGVTIGVEAFVAAGAVVTRDVPDRALVAGNPASLRGYVCTCAVQLDDALYCSRCDRHFRRNDANGVDPVVT